MKALFASLEDQLEQTLAAIGAARADAYREAERAVADLELDASRLAAVDGHTEQPELVQAIEAVRSNIAAALKRLHVEIDQLHDEAIATQKLTYEIMKRDVDGTTVH